MNHRENVGRRVRVWGNIEPKQQSTAIILIDRANVIARQRVVRRERRRQRRARARRDDRLVLELLLLKRRSQRGDLARHLERPLDVGERAAVPLQIDQIAVLLRRRGRRGRRRVLHQLVELRLNARMLALAKQHLLANLRVPLRELGEIAARRAALHLRASVGVLRDDSLHRNAAAGRVGVHAGRDVLRATTRNGFSFWWQQNKKDSQMQSFCFFNLLFTWLKSR